VPDVFLHVGPVKTGSTYLQSLLWAHRADLARQGVLVPLEHANEMWPAVNDVQDGAFLQFEMPEARGAWQRVTARALAYPNRSVLSHEVLGLSTDDHVDRIVETLHPANLHVVVMARSLAVTMPSLWQETVKMADDDESWPAFLDRQRDEGAPWTDTAAIVERWARHLPSSRIHVITVPPRGAPSALLLSRFAEALGIDVTGWEYGAAGNESLDAVSAELLRRLNLTTSAFLDRRAQRRLNNIVLLPHLRRAQSGSRLRLPTSHRTWIEQETRRRVSALAGSGAVLHGTWRDLDAPEDVWEAAPTAVSERDLLEAALELLARSHAGRTPEDDDAFL
jgi:hypothetical protein